MKGFIMVTARKNSVGRPAKKATAKKIVAKKISPSSKVASVVRAAKAVKAAKVVKATKAPTASPTAPMAKPIKLKKPKLVRDSFTMPQAEYDVLAATKKACIAAGFEVKKSELLRIGVSMLKQLDTKKIQLAQQSLLPLKVGRPSKKK